MRRAVKLLAALAAVLAMGSASVVGAADKDLLADIKARGYMRVGTFSIPPEAWIDIGSGEWMGIDADFTKAIAKSLGVEVDPIVLVHTEMIPALNSGRLDAIAGLYYTDERAKAVSYNTIPFWYGIDVLITQRDNGRLKSFADLKGKTIGTVRGSAQEIEANTLKDRFGVGDIRKFDSADPMLLDLKAKRLDAAIWWGFTYDYAAKKNPKYDFRVVEYMPAEYLGKPTLPGTHFIFKKGPETESLVKAFDAALEKMLAAGESRKVLEKYGLTNPAYWTGKMGK